MHRISTNLATGIIEIEVSGFWKLDQLGAFADEVAEQARSVRLNGKRQAILYDYTQAAIQSQDVVTALREMAARDAFKSRKVALYSAGRLARLQARRIAECSDRFAVFEDRGAALDWLTAV